MSYQPTSIQEICQFVKEQSSIYCHGGSTKLALAEDGPGLNMTALSGIIDYQPDEYVFTAYSGTALAEINDVLLQKGQFLPFDPIFVDDGATLGGTIAANSCGPGRYRYGGVRDYILRISIVDGEGRPFSGGEKVVKNAAGFDLPKFFVGSRGKFGVITEASFKVFPMPPASLGIIVKLNDLKTAHKAVVLLGRSPFDIHALDLLPSASSGYQLFIRLSGLAKALQERSERIIGYLKQEISSRTAISILGKDEDLSRWANMVSIKKARAEECLFQVATTIQTFQQLEEEPAIRDSVRRYCSAANLLFLYTSEPDRIKATLQSFPLPFLILDGNAKIKQTQTESALPMYSRLKQVFDPKNKFGDL